MFTFKLLDQSLDQSDPEKDPPLIQSSPPHQDDEENVTPDIEKEAEVDPTGAVEEDETVDDAIQESSDCEIVEDEEADRPKKRVRKRKKSKPEKEKKPVVNKKTIEEFKFDLSSKMTDEPGVYQCGDWKFKKLKKETKWTCLECGRTTATRLSMARHINMIHILRAVPNNTQLTVDDDGIYHYKNWKFERNEDGLFKCGHCEHVNKYKPRIMAHIDKWHNEGTVQKVCDKCSKTWSGEEFDNHECVVVKKIKYYKNEHLGDGKYVYDERWPYETVEGVGFKCGMCGIIKRTASHMCQHIRSRYIVTQEFHCELCEFTTTHRDVMADHKASHSGVTLACDVCGKKFDVLEGAGKLRQHKLIHGTQRYPCGTCDKIYKSVGSRKSHFNVTGHQESTEKKEQSSRQGEKRQSSPVKSPQVPELKRSKRLQEKK